MNISLYLGRFFGLYLVIVGIALLVRSKSIRKIITHIADDPALIFVSGVITLMFGLLFVLAHNIWEWNWSLAVTLLAYLTLIKGIVRLYFPEQSQKIIKKYEKPLNLRIMALLCVLLGIYLILCSTIALESY